MTGSPTDDIRGCPPDTIRQAIADGRVLPGVLEDDTAVGEPTVFQGYAGVLSADQHSEAPRLVRDVLGREPLFRDGMTVPPAESGSETADGSDIGVWARDPRELVHPVRHPPGMINTPTGQTDLLTLPDPDPADPATALQNVDRAVETVFGPTEQSRDSGDGETNPANSTAVDAIAFSGGVDSTLIAATHPKATLYVGGFEGSHDREAAEDVAAAMGRDLRVVEFTHETLLEAVPQVVAATGKTNPMDVGIAVPLYLVARAAASDGVDTFGVGQGADELFGGYAKMADPATDSRLESETVRDAQREVIAGLPAQLERDVLTLRAAGVEPWTPFLDDRVIDAALRLPGQLLATQQLSKVALRRVAAEYVPRMARDADKKAVQYGSYVSRELDRLARQDGYKKRIDDHVGKYIRSIVSDAGVDPPTVRDSLSTPHE